MSDQPVQNTDREIWRGKSRAEFGDDARFYADSLFVPEGEVEALGINCGGMVIVKPIREWHKSLTETEVRERERAVRLDEARWWCESVEAMQTGGLSIVHKVRIAKLQADGD